MPLEPNIQSQLLEILDKVYEEKFYESVEDSTLCRQLSLASRQELELLIASLFMEGWVEKDAESVGGYFRLRLTHHGKDKYDKANQNTANALVRKSLLSALAGEYRRNVHAVVDSEDLARTLNLDWNKVCFNLEIMRLYALVELEERYGVGHASYLVKLTPEGKYAHDNPERNLVFLSHASIDEEIAKYLKRLVEQSLADTDVFVSTDPEDLPPGHPWVEKILDNLNAASVMVVLATERGLGRRWVWYEVGAGWARGLVLYPCCLGKTHKGELPAPFSRYQSLNLDEERDLNVLLVRLSKELGIAFQAPDIPPAVAELKALEELTEARDRAARSPFSAGRREMVAKWLNGMTPDEKEALRLLLVCGPLTDQQAISQLKGKGLAKDNPLAIFTRIHKETTLLNRLWPFDRTELQRGYEGPYDVRPDFKTDLEELLGPT